MHSLKRLFTFSIATVLLVAIAGRAQILPTAPIDPKVLPTFPETRVSRIPQPEHVQLSNNVPGVVEPVLIPQPIPAYSTECKGARDSGSVVLTFIVDANGDPRNVMFKKVLENQLDLLALKVVLQSHFTPAKIDGVSAAFALDVEIHLDVCTDIQPGASTATTRLRGPTAEKFEPWRKAPAEANLAPLKMPADAIADAENWEKDGVVGSKPISPHRVLPTKGMSGSFAFGLLVDEHGVAHIEKVLRSTNPALLPIAAAMIQNSRRTPALKHGMPVPMHEMDGIAMETGR